MMHFPLPLPATACCDGESRKPVHVLHGLGYLPLVRLRKKEKRDHGRDGQGPDDEVGQAVVNQGQEVDQEGGHRGSDLRAGVEKSVGGVADRSWKDFLRQESDAEKIDAEKQSETFQVPNRVT